VRVTATLAALRDAYAALAGAVEGDEGEPDPVPGGEWAPRLARVQGIIDLRSMFEDTCKLRGRLAILAAEALRRRRAEYPEDPERSSWELAQIDLACGRLYATGREWTASRDVLAGLIERSDAVGAHALIDFGTYAHYARALRECDEFVPALRCAAECVRRDPLNVEGRREAGRAHFALGQYADALAAWKQALWLSPSDPYLHYEVAMCHRRMATRHDDAVRQRELASAAKHFDHAQELFDGEDLDGEAWSRLWLGRVALEGGDPETAVAHLEAAEHGTATAAAALLLGEAHLAREQRTEAQHAFDRCAAALDREREPGAAPTTARLRGRATIDAGWGDELPEGVVRARLERGLAEARCVVPGPSQDPRRLRRAEAALERAREHLAGVDRPRDAEARDRALAMCLDTEARVLQAHGRLEPALKRTRERLRFDASPQALERERELLAALGDHGASRPRPHPAGNGRTPPAGMSGAPGTASRRAPGGARPRFGRSSPAS
jgi:tetratricopeptide (TPR) repeat protein